MPDYLITWIHLIAVVTLMGGLIFSQFVLTPAVRNAASDPKAQDVIRLSGQRVRTLAWVSVITLILTGAYLLLNESGSARIETAWGVVLMLKLFLFVIAFGLLLIHDFIMDPYTPVSKPSLNVPASVPGSSRADTLQKAVLVLTLAILLVASYLSKT